MNERGVSFRHYVVTKPQVVQHPGAERLDHNVGTVG